MGEYLITIRLIQEVMILDQDQKYYSTEKNIKIHKIQESLSASFTVRDLKYVCSSNLPIFQSQTCQYWLFQAFSFFNTNTSWSKTRRRDLNLEQRLPVFQTARCFDTPCIFALSTFVNSDSNCPGRKSVQQLCLSLLSTHPAFSYKKFCRLRGLCCLGRIFCKWMFVNIWVNPFKHRCLFHWLCINFSPEQKHTYMLLQRHNPD